MIFQGLGELASGLGLGPWSSKEANLLSSLLHTRPPPPQDLLTILHNPTTTAVAPYKHTP